MKIKSIRKQVHLSKFILYCTVECSYPIAIELFSLFLNHVARYTWMDISLDVCKKAVGAKGAAEEDSIGQ